MAVNSDDPRTPRIQIADTLRSEITDGTHPAGSRLPSVQKLSDRFAVSTTTVQAALDLLRQESLVHAIGTRGTFVGPAETAQDGSSDIDERVAILEKQVSDLASRLAAVERKEAGHA